MIADDKLRAENALLQAQLIQCTTAMREVSGLLRRSADSEIAMHDNPCFRDGLRIQSDKLDAARGNAVDVASFNHELFKENERLKQSIRDSDRMREAQLSDAWQECREKDAENAKLKAEVERLNRHLDAKQESKRQAYADLAEKDREIKTILAEHDADLVTLNRVRDMCREVAAQLQGTCPKHSACVHTTTIEALAQRLLDAANGTEAKTEQHAINCERRTKGICLCNAPAHIQPQPVAAPSPAPSEPERSKLEEWLRGSDCGLSSETICRLLGNLGPPRSPSYPHDSGDFGRCYRLLKMFPSWRGRMGEVAAAYPQTPWPAYVANWDRMTSLFEEGKRTELYEFMRQLQRLPHTPAETAKDEPRQCLWCNSRGMAGDECTCDEPSQYEQGLRRQIDSLIQERDAARAEAKKAQASADAWQKAAKHERGLLVALLDEIPYEDAINAHSRTLTENVERAIATVQHLLAEASEQRRIADSAKTTADAEPTTHYTAMQEVKRLREVIVQLERIRLRTGQLLDAIEHTEQPDAIAVLQREHQDLCRKRRELLKDAGVA